MKEQNLNIKHNKGITLIALIITIVVLLILALVSIGTIKDSGIIKHAQDASNDYTVAQEKEKIQLAVTEAYLAGNGRISEDNLKSAIESQLGEEITLTGSGNNGYVITTGAGKQYSIKSNGSVSEYKEELERIYYVVNGAWASDYKSSESELPSGTTITAKFYKTNNKFTPVTDSDLTDMEIELPEGYEYKLRISGQGNMPVLIDEENDTYSAWFQEVADLMQGNREDCQNIMIFYTTEAIIDGVNNVGELAFQFATNLIDCYLGSSVKKIEKYAFSNSGIKSIEMNGVETICQAAFEDCDNLNYIKLGDNVTTLSGECVFENCNNLTTVDLNKVSKINSATMFASCEKLKTIILRTESIEEIDNSAFNYSNDATIYVLNESVKQSINSSDQSRVVIKTLVEMDNLK